MNRMLRIERGSGNVFLDLGIGKAEAENLKLRSELMMRIADYRKASGPAGMSVRLVVKKAA